MKWIWALLSVVFFSSCGDGGTPPDIQYREGATVLTVEGMYCSACRQKVMRELAKVEGVDWAQIEYEVGEVAYAGTVETTEVVAAIQNAGYEVVE